MIPMNFPDILSKIGWLSVSRTTIKTDWEIERYRELDNLKQGLLVDILQKNLIYSNDQRSASLFSTNLY